MSRKKVVMFINSLGVGGAEKVFTRICNCYHENNVDFKVLSLLKLTQYPIEKSIKKEFLSNSESIHLKSLPLLFFKFVRFCLTNKPDIVQSHLFWANYINVLSTFFSKHESQLVHCVSFDSKFQRGIARHLHFLFCRTLLPRARLNVFKSYEMRDEYINNFRIDRNKTLVIYNPVEHNVLSTNVRSFNVKEAFNVVVVGRFHSSKRHFDLLNIAKTCSNKVKFHCIGDGEFFSDFVQEVNRTSLESKFEFYGWVSDVKEILPKMDLYLSCSESEGFPNSLVEAMTFGLPVLHSNCRTGPSEIIGGKTTNIAGEDYKREYGILFDVGDVELVSSIIHHFENDVLSLAHYSNLSLSRAKELLSMSDIKNYLHLVTR